MKFRNIFVLIALLILSSNINATVIDNGLHTTDLSTGLHWLDLTETTSMSYDYVSSQLGVGGQFEGYRYATTSDIDDLQVSAGLFEGLFSATPSFYKQLGSELIDMLGITQTNSSRSYVYGLTSEPFPGAYPLERVGRALEITPIYISATQFVGDDSSDSSWMGSWLVRDTLPVSTPVSNPAAILLLATGLLGLVGTIKRRALS